MPEHNPTRTDRLALYMRARAAEKATHDEAVAVVERWNAAIAWMFAMSLDLHAPDAVVIRGTADYPEPIRADANVSNAADTFPLPAPPIPADADLRAIPEMPVKVAKVIAFAKTVPSETFRAAMINRSTD